MCTCIPIHVHIQYIRVQRRSESMFLVKTMMSKVNELS